MVLGFVHKSLHHIHQVTKKYSTILILGFLCLQVEHLDVSYLLHFSLEGQTGSSTWSMLISRIWYITEQSNIYWRCPMMGRSGSYPRGTISSWTISPRIPIMAARPLLSSMARLESLVSSSKSSEMRERQETSNN